MWDIIGYLRGGIDGALRRLGAARDAEDHGLQERHLVDMFVVLAAKGSPGKPMQ